MKSARAAIGRATGIYLVGAANQDTDEYDRHVIAHEFGHYLEDQFSRSDSFGGSHALTDQLDMRVAFGEAWGSAFAAMVTAQEIYVDTHSAGQARAFSFDLEQSPSRINPNPGWFNEESLQSLLFDLYDNGRDVPRGTTSVDDLALGFGPIWAVFTNEQRSTRALTSVFPFVNALKAARPADVPLIDQLTTSQRIATVTDEYGSGQTNFGLPTQRTQLEVAADFHSVYDSLPVNGSLPERLQPRRLHERADGRREQARVAAFRALHRGESRRARHHGARARAAECGGRSRHAAASRRRPDDRVLGGTGGHVHRGRSRRMRRDVFADAASGRLRPRGVRVEQHQPHRRRDLSADRPHLLRRDGDAMKWRVTTRSRRRIARLAGVGRRRAACRRRCGSGARRAARTSRRARSSWSYRLATEPAVGVPLDDRRHGARRGRRRQPQHRSQCHGTRAALVSPPLLEAVAGGVYSGRSPSCRW